MEAEAQRESRALCVVLNEDVTGWGAAIAHWLKEQAPAEPVSMVALQQSLEMPMVEVWMGLLLSQELQYQFEQRGEFYEPLGIWLQI